MWRSVSMCAATYYTVWKHLECTFNEGPLPSVFSKTGFGLLQKNPSPWATDLGTRIDWTLKPKLQSYRFCNRRVNPGSVDNIPNVFVLMWAGVRWCRGAWGKRIGQSCWRECSCSRPLREAPDTPQPAAAGRGCGGGKLLAEHGTGTASPGTDRTYRP